MEVFLSILVSLCNKCSLELLELEVQESTLNIFVVSVHFGFLVCSAVPAAIGVTGAEFSPAQVPPVLSGHLVSHGVCH